MTDPFLLQVLTGSLRSAAGKMACVLAAAAASPALKYCLDCSAAIYSPEGRLLAVADGLPLHPGIFPAAVGGVIKSYPVQSLQQGDCIITNDPYLTGSPASYILALSPVFYGGRPLALAASLARHSDLGGSAPGGMSALSVDIFQEGIRIPPVKIVRRGEPSARLLSLLTSNVRIRDGFLGDLRAQVAASRSAEKALVELAAKYGPEKLRRCMSEIVSHSNRKIRTALKGLPPGDHRIEESIGWNGPRGGVLKISITLKIAGESLTADFTGTQSQVAGPVNITAEAARACVYTAVWSALEPGLPLNDGVFGPIEVTAPDASLVGARFPAAVALGNLVTGRRIIEAIYGCLAGIRTGVRPTAGTGSVAVVTFGGVDPRHGSYYAWVETIEGGRGAGPHGDGPDGGRPALGAAAAPVEVMEQCCPLVVNSCGLAGGTGGAGKYRGGAGVRKSITFLEDVSVISAAASPAESPREPGGDLPAGCPRVSIRRPGGAGEVTGLSPGRFAGTLEKGACVSLETPGGSGFGNPLERDPEAVMADVLEGFVPEEEAVRVYGVILDNRGLRFDPEATAGIRSEMRKSDPGVKERQTDFR